MWYALQDEPEKGHRLAILAVGVIIAAGLQGGGLVAAANYTPPPGLKKTAKSVVEFVVPPPPPPKEEPPPPEPPKVEEPKVEEPKPEPKPEPPKPKPKPKPEPKPKPKPKPEPKPEPQAPTEKPPPAKPAPVKIGMFENSTDARGAGPTVDVGNTTQGEFSDTATPPVRGRPTPGDRVVEGEPAPPPAPPVKTRADCALPRTSADDYPRAARRAGITGVVTVVATVEADGKVSAAKAVKTLGFGLDEKALEIVQSATCKPATVDKVGVRSMVRLSVRFELRD